MATSPLAAAFSRNESPSRRELSSWRDIEPVLKWGAVAYAWGFVTIMFHTSRLGIPALQVIEPINIWVGLPLAIVTYFADTMALYFWKNLSEFRAEIVGARLEWKDIHSFQSSAESVINSSANLLASQMRVFLPYLGSRVRSWVVERYKQYGQKLIGLVGLKRLPLQDWFAHILFLLRSAFALFTLVGAIYLLFIIVFAMWFYIWIFYPFVPQTLGGGRPMNVQLMLEAEKIAGGIVLLLTDGSKTKGGKTFTTAPLMLYYETDDTYYVRKDKGPFLSLRHDAVAGVIYSETWAGEIANSEASSQTEAAASRAARASINAKQAASAAQAFAWKVQQAEADRPPRPLRPSPRGARQAKMD